MILKNNKIAFILNSLISLLTVLALIMMFTGFKFMSGKEVALESTKLGMLRFFTVQSNLLMGIISFFFAYLEGKKKTITKNLYILKFMATSAVTLTLLTVFLYLGPITKYGLSSLLMNSNLFLHLIIPCLSILTFVFFEKTNKISFKESFYGILPTAIYGVYYVTNILIHTKNGKVSTMYDWYWFVQNGVSTALYVVPIIFLFSYLISFVLWKWNHIK